MQKIQNVAGDPNVILRTVNVTFEIYTQDGSLAAGEASYYAKGWKTFGKGKTSRNKSRPLSMQMFPVAYTFAAKLGSQKQQKKQDVSTNPSVEFVFDTSDSVFKSEVHNTSEEESYVDALIGIIQG